MSLAKDKLGLYLHSAANNLLVKSPIFPTFELVKGVILHKLYIPRCYGCPTYFSFLNDLIKVAGPVTISKFAFQALLDTLHERLRTHTVFTKDQCFYLEYNKFSIKSYVLDVY